MDSIEARGVTWEEEQIEVLKSFHEERGDVTGPILIANRSQWS